ncbi:hypothetical protein [Bacillus atrophaeus]|uniref:hypothetical protein n=1 Tax=Bacillus atrophaeus TaxID=1452 RepID=UPI000D03E833|nr:hypothetical protein [Bacillus atrophaeus]PRR87394.1 hypothetical protein C6W23_18780 [Bacillus atrophaeus]
MNKDVKEIWSGFFIGSGSLIVVGLLILIEALTMSLVVFYGLNHVLNPLLIDTYNVQNVHITLPHAFVIGVLLNIFVKGVKQSDQEKNENIFKKAGKSLLHSAFALLVLYVSTLFI